MARRRGFVASVVVGLLLLCAVYCFVAPKQYEACATVALRQGSPSSLNMEAPEPSAIASLLSAPLQLETLADVLRSDRLAWRVITELKLYQEPGFMGSFAQKFPGFHPEAPGGCPGVLAGEVSEAASCAVGAANAADSNPFSLKGRSLVGRRSQHPDSRLPPAGERLAD
jgi:hypothetical protein